MMKHGIAAALVADGRGILAADETVPSLTKRFDALGIQSTEKSRRTSGPQVLYHRARCNGSASRGHYTQEMGAEGIGFSNSPHRHAWRDD